MRLLIIIISIVLSLSVNSSKQIIESGSILSLPEYKDIKLDNIEKITTTHFGEGGEGPTTSYTSKEDIKLVYDSLANIKIVGTTTSGCEDNTMVYNIFLKNGTKKGLAFECDVLVVGNKRLLVKD